MRLLKMCLMFSIFTLFALIKHSHKYGIDVAGIVVGSILGILFAALLLRRLARLARKGVFFSKMTRRETKIMFSIGILCILVGGAIGGIKGYFFPERQIKIGTILLAFVFSSSTVTCGVHFLERHYGQKFYTHRKKG